MDNLTSLANRLRIIELVNLFGIAIDLRKWDSFRGLFTDLVEFDYSSIGVVAGNLPPDEIVNTARHDLSGFQAKQHQSTNLSITVLSPWRLIQRLGNQLLI